MVYVLKVSVNKLSIILWGWGGNGHCKSCHWNLFKLLVENHENCQCSAVKDGKVKRLEKRLNPSSFNVIFCSLVQELIIRQSHLKIRESCGKIFQWVIVVGRIVVLQCSNTVETFGLCKFPLRRDKQLLPHPD